MDFTESIDFTFTKVGSSEELDFAQACLDESRNRQDSITTEDIAAGDEILDTYSVDSDAIPGGMGSVWRVRHIGWGVELAMKRPHPRFFAEAGPRRKEAFIRECEHWIKLGLHPNIVSCYYVREVGGVPTIFSEWMSCGSLKDAIASESLYEGSEEEVAERILDIAIQAARGLSYSHEQDLLHQDVKPGNLLVADGWEVKVADFGLARAASRLVQSDEQEADPWAGLYASALDGLGMYASAPAALKAYTPAYCPKEQAEGKPAEPWMDLYAWVLCVLEMYAGEILWESGAVAAESFGGYAERLRVPAPDGLLDFLEECLDSRGELSFEDACDGCEQLYRRVTGKRYPRADARAAMNSAETLNNYALSFIDLGMGQRALELWDAAVQVDSSCVSAAYNRTLYGYRTGLLDDVAAVAEMRSLAYSGENKLEAFMALARIQLECRDAVLTETLDKIEQLFPQAEIPDLEEMRTAAADNRVKEVYRFNNPDYGPVDVSPDGNYLLIHDSKQGRETETLVFCDLESREEISRMIREPDVEPHSEVRARLSRNNRYAFGMYAQDPFLYRWSTSDGAQSEASVMRKLPGEQICAFDIDASGDRLLLASTRGRVALTRPGIGESKPLGDFQGHFGLSITADGTRGLVFCTEENRIVVRDDEGEGIEITVTRPVFAHFALEDSCVFSISEEVPPMIRLHDAWSGACRYEVPFPRLDEFANRQRQFSISLDGRRLMLRGDGGYLLFDIAAHRWLLTLTSDHIGEPTNLTFKSYLPGAGTRVYLTSFMSSLRGLELPEFTEDSPWSLSAIHTAKQSLEEEEAFEGFCDEANAALDSGNRAEALEAARKASAVGGGTFRSSESYAMLVRRLAPLCKISTVGTPLLLERQSIFAAPVASMSVSPDGGWIALLSQSGELAVADAASGEVFYRDGVRRYDHTKKPTWCGATVYSLAVAGMADGGESPSRPFRVNGAQGQEARMGISYRGVDLGQAHGGRIYGFDMGLFSEGADLARRAFDQSNAKAPIDAVTDFQVLHSGDEFLCRRRDGSICKINVYGAKRMLKDADEEYQISGSALSGNGRVAVQVVGDIMNFGKAETCSSKAFFYDANSGKILFTTDGVGVTSACSFTRDGRYALVGNTVFDFNSGAQGKVPIDVSQHAAFLESRFAVSFGSDEALQVCELCSRTPVLSAEVGDAPTALDCSPDGVFLYVGNSKGEVATWLWDHEYELR